MKGSNTQKDEEIGPVLAYGAVMRTFVRDAMLTDAGTRPVLSAAVPFEDRNMSEMLAGNRKISVTITRSADHTALENASIEPK
ncbi:hypothetical protein [Pararhizobium qamdonense]|uniref:hypothetical protein n=1 Tax=Pararhizobium qamdonense TaxID=3031126 RepID=UPI0023E32948|nr:hypothetical protein [Pararhizobium qamdonense]